MPHRKEPTDFTHADIANLILAYRQQAQHTSHRAALAQTVVDLVDECLIALTNLRDASIIAADWITGS